MLNLEYKHSAYILSSLRYLENVVIFFRNKIMSNILLILIVVLLVNESREEFNCPTTKIVHGVSTTCNRYTYQGNSELAANKCPARDPKYDKASIKETTAENTNNNGVLCCCSSLAPHMSRASIAAIVISASSSFVVLIMINRHFG